MDRLFWLDMEMTGLDVNKEVIIEVAAIVTDLNFRELDTFEAVVKQPQHYLDNMDDWNREHHTDSGLAAKVPNGMEPYAVEQRLIEMARKFFPDPKNKVILAGNSIAQDRLFIEKYFTQFASLLHYRTLDVTSWKLIYANRFGFIYKKQNQHRALDDIRESIQELQAYVSYVQAPNTES